MRPAFAPWLATTNDITAGFLAARPGLVNMAGGLPAPETFPSEELAEIAKSKGRFVYSPSQAEEDARFEKFKAENPSPDFGNAGAKEDRQARMN